MIKFYTFVVMTFAILHVKVSSCVHYVMKGVTFGTSETLVMLLVPFSCLTMAPQCFLQLLCLFGVSGVDALCNIIQNAKICIIH